MATSGSECDRLPPQRAHVAKSQHFDRPSDLSFSESLGVESQCRLQTGLFVRSLTLAKLAFMAKSNGRSRCNGADIQPQLEAQASEIARELGRLKGSAMKVGQLLSIYGERFLPPQVNSILKCLQSHAPPLDWKSIEPALREELGTAYDELEIETRSLAAASIGQVHQAKVKSTGERIALKIQYPKIERAITSDLRALKTVLAFGPFVSSGMPAGSRLSEMVAEVDEMLRRELDYQKEAACIRLFHEGLAEDPRFLVPRVHTRWTTSKVLAIDLICGHRIDAEAVRNLSQERRNNLAEALLELYLKELFEFGFVQTDAHVGNYRVRIQGEATCQNQTADRDTVVLIDFGAVRELCPKFLGLYRSLIGGSLYNDLDVVTDAGLKLGFLRENDNDEVRKEFFQFCRLVVEPFTYEGVKDGALYDWGQSTLPSRLAAQLTRVINVGELRAPPREVPFLDRKSSGLYVLMGLLGAKTNSRRLLEKALEGCFVPA